MCFKEFFKVFITLDNTRPGSEKNLLLSLYQIMIKLILTVSLACTQCLVGFVNKEILHDEVDIPGSFPFKGL